MAMANEPESQVGQRMAALLPDLLLALRRRTRRARRRRLAVAALVAAAPACWLAWLLAGSGAAVPATPVAAPAWTFVRDDPGLLARCSVAPVVRPAWFVGDDELHVLLGDAARPAGLVRVGERVFVAAAAIDPWPGDSP